MPHSHIPLQRQLKQDMKAADKGRPAGPVPSKASLSRRGSIAAKESGKPAHPTTATAAAIAAAAATTAASIAARGQAPAAVGTPTPAKAEAAAAAGKPHPAAAGAVPAVASPADAAKAGAAAAKPAGEGADAFIYEEYGFPSAAEPMPAANPLLIISVLIAYFLFVSACFLIIKYAYHGYDVNAPDVHTVTSKDLLAPIQFDPKDLEDGAPPPEGSRRLATGRAAKRFKKPARSKSGRRRTTHSTWEEEQVTLMAAVEMDYVSEVSAKSPVEEEKNGGARSADSRHGANGTDGAAATDDDSVSFATTRRAGRPKSLNKRG